MPAGRAAAAGAGLVLQTMVQRLISTQRAGDGVEAGTLRDAQAWAARPTASCTAGRQAYLYAPRQAGSCTGRSAG